MNCTSLESVTIPGSITSLAGGAFMYCTSLTSINVTANNTNYVSTDSAVFTHDMSALIQFFPGLIGSYTVPDTVASIASDAFHGCNLTSVTIPSSVVSIGDSAFYGCSNLATVNLPPRIMSIQSSTFRDCRSLTNVTIPSSVESIGDCAFYGCTSLKSITIPPNVKTIAAQAFLECAELERVAITSDITSLAEAAFQSCTNLKTYIYSGTTVPECASDAFIDCNALEHVSAPIDYDNDTFCGIPVYSKTASVSVDLRVQHNHCYEVIVGSNSGDDAFVQKRANATLWESESSPCEGEHLCKNDTGAFCVDLCNTTNMYPNCFSSTCKNGQCVNISLYSGNGNETGCIICESTGWVEVPNNCSAELISYPFTPSINETTYDCYAYQCGIGGTCTFSPSRNWNEVKSLENECYEAVCENNEWILKKRYEAIEWEKQSHECEQCVCENDTGFSSNNTCIEINTNVCFVEIEITMDELNTSLIDFNMTEFVQLFINITGEEGQIVIYAEKRSEENKRILWVKVMVSDEDIANRAVEQIKACVDD